MILYSETYQNKTNALKFNNIFTCDLCLLRFIRTVY